MKRAFRLCCFVMAVSLASLMFLGWTEPGLRLLTYGMNRLSGGDVAFGSVKGALLLAFQLEDVSITTPAVQLRLGGFGSSWQLLELFNKRLHVAGLTARDVDIILPEQEETSGDDGDITLPKLALPVLLVLENLTVENLRLLAADSSELTRIDRLSFGLSGSGNQFRLLDFTLTGPGYGGNLQGSLDTGKDWYVELAGNVEYKDYGVGPFVGNVSLKGPLARLETVVDLQRPARGHIEGQIKDLPNSFSWNADLALYDVQLADGHEVLPEMLFTVTGSAEGEMLSYGGTLKGKIDYLFFKDVSFEGEVHGNEDQIAFTTVTTENAQGKARLTDGLLSWKDGLLWHGHLELEGVDPAMFDTDYPGAINADLYSSGSYGDTKGLVLDADFKTFSGLLRGYELAGHGRLQVDAQSILLDDVELQSGKAILKLDGRAESAAGLSHWRESLSWKAGLQLADFDPALFFPDYPGTLSTEINSAGDINADSVRGRADIVALNGVLRGYPVKGKGTIRLDDKLVHFDDLLVQSGHSTLKVSGQAGDALDVSVELNSANIGEFLEDAKGSLKVAGKVSGTRNAPLFDADIVAKKLSYDDTVVDDLEAHLKGGIDNESALSAQLKGHGLQAGSLAVKSVNVTLNGLPGKHRYSAELQTTDGVVTLQGSGGLGETFSWAGDIRDLSISHPLTGEWQQKGAAAVAVSGEKSHLESFCIGSGDERICLAGDWLQDTMNWSAELSWQQLDLSRLKTLMAMQKPVRGTSSAKISVSGDLSRLLSAKGALEIQDAGLGDGKGESEWDSLRMDSAVLKANLQSGVLKTDLAADFADGSVLVVTTEIPGVGPYNRDLTTLGLRGKLRADLRNLEFVTPLTNYFVHPSGSLKGALELSGTVLRPIATGQLDLVDGQLDFPDLGITMKDVQFVLTGTENAIDILATASSGPGTLRAEGNLLLESNGVVGDFRFTGENFDTTMLPEYEIRTTPDLHFVFDSDGGRLTGRVNIPHAVLAPERMTDSLRVSEDVIYLDGEDKEGGGGWLFSTSLQLDLGQDVRLDGYGITGYLRGDLLVEKSPGTQMTGKGQLSLADGLFSVYGRTMSIERSRVLFASGPIDSPSVNVRARKIVADNKKRNETIEVGVDVTGTVDNLEFNLFSNPPMEERDILAYMVVGRSRSNVGQKDESLLNSAAMALGLDKSLGVFDELSDLLLVDEVYLEGSQTDEMAVVVGKHLTDELFIGYGHNFFDQQGEVRLRYDLGSGFSIESRSSGEATGADLLYSFEK